MSTKSNVYTILYKCGDQHRTIKNSKMAHPTKHTDELYMSKLLNSSEKHRFSHFLFRPKQRSTRGDSWLQTPHHCQRLLGLQHFHLIFSSSMCLPTSRLSLHSCTHGEFQPGYLPQGLFSSSPTSTYLHRLPAPWQGPGLTDHTLPPQSSSRHT